MTLDEALACNDRGIAKAKELGVQVALVVVDEFGQLVQLDRMDGASLMSPDVAEAKAITALNFKLPTREVARLKPEALREIGDVVHFKLVTAPGGLPIFDDSVLKGAIGVSGAESAQDELIALHALGR
jgi:glc operon protein GlcG